MTATSRSPLEFVAAVGVLVITIAIVEVPRGPMLPEPDWSRPAAEDRDAATLPGPSDAARADTAALPGADAPWPDRRRADRLRAALEHHRDRLARRRSRLAAAELLFLHAQSRVAPLEAAYADALDAPQETVTEILDRRDRLRDGRRAVLAGHRTLNDLRHEIDERARSVAAATLRVRDLDEQLAALAAGAPD